MNSLPSTWYYLISSREQLPICVTSVTSAYPHKIKRHSIMKMQEYICTRASPIYNLFPVYLSFLPKPHSSTSKRERQIGNGTARLNCSISLSQLLTVMPSLAFVL